MAHNKFYRNFIILQEDENTHASSKEKALSGYAKIEAKNDKCKISFYAQNLLVGEKYSIVLICYKKDMKQIVDLGSLVVEDSGKAEVSKEYYINNIAGINLSYEKISGAAVCKHKEGKLNYLMYGFMNGEHIKDDWKKCKIIKSSQDEDIIMPSKKMEIKKQDKKVKEDTKEYKKEYHEEKHEEDKYDCKSDDCDNKKDNHHEKKDDCHEKKDGYHEKKDDCHEKKDGYHEKKDDYHEKKDDCYDKKDEKKKEYKCPVCSQHKKKNDDCSMKEYVKDCEDNCEYNYKNRENLKVDFDEYERRIEQQKEIDAFDFELRGELGEYFKDISKGFEEVKNKFKEIKYCKWYKIKINTIDDMCNSSNYNKYTIAFYPMINYYPYIRKYGYYMLGYKCDKNGEIKYLVYGIPGKKDKDDQPFMGKTGFVTWMKTDNKDMGCWLMFYDYRNSTVVVPMSN